jgi:4'-phosphopantetheinyl transferase
MTNDEAGAVQSSNPDSLSATRLAKGEVHLWRSAMNASEHALCRFRETLCEEELVRADRFRFPHLRRRFVAGRGALRTILADYLSIEPRRVMLSYSAHGKPSLANAPVNIEFNVSHSDDLLVIALCLNQPIGVDIEKEEPQFPVMQIAARFFCQSEQRALAALEGERRLRAFFQIWTAKEALLKANSLGFSVDPSKVEVALNPLRFISGESGDAESRRWHLSALTLEAGYSGALAVMMEPSRITFRDWPDSFPELQQSHRPADTSPSQAA